MLTSLIEKISLFRKKRSLKKAGVVQEFGYKKTQHQIDGKTVEYAQWLHPRESEKFVRQSKVDAYRTLIPSGSTVIDIGAHTGDTAIVYGLAAGPSGTVFALEPNPYVFKILEANSQLNTALSARCIPLNFAATQDDGQFEFLYSDNGFCNGGNLSVIKNQKHNHNFKLKVEGKNLNSFLASYHPESLEKLSLIKTDTEGYDLFVLKSLAPMIRKHKPVVICEVLKKFTEPERIELVEYIKSFGYNTFVLDEERPNLKGPSVNSANTMQLKSYDVVAVKR